MTSMRFEMVEGLAAAAAAIERLAGCGAELADALDRDRSAAGAGNRRGDVDELGRRSDAVLAQTLASARAEPVGSPGRCETGFEAEPGDAVAAKLGFDVARDHGGRGASGIRRRNRNHELAVAEFNAANDAEIDDRDHRDLGIGHGFEPTPNFGNRWCLGAYHLAPGK